MLGNILKYIKSQIEPSPSELKGLFLILALAFMGVGYDYYKKLRTPKAVEIKQRQEQFKIDTTTFVIERRVFVKRKPKPSKININTASIEELISLPGIGPKTAERIYEYRKKHGKFKDVNELLNVKGIGPKKLEKIKPYIYL